LRDRSKLHEGEEIGRKSGALPCLIRVLDRMAALVLDDRNNL
jgi:hypothetical protein